MLHDLDYYRSLTPDHLISLPMDEYVEYLSLLSESSNQTFRADLEKICKENCSSELISRNTRGETLDYYMKLDISDLKKEIEMIYRFYHYCLSCCLVDSFVFDYIGLVFDIAKDSLVGRLICDEYDCLVLADGIAQQAVPGAPVGAPAASPSLILD